MITLNIVTCGSCWQPFGHKPHHPRKRVKDLFCPYCGFNEDICHFPDLWYPPEHRDSLIKINR